jgi:hypothetical protein
MYIYYIIFLHYQHHIYIYIYASYPWQHIYIYMLHTHGNTHIGLDIEPARLVIPRLVIQTS